MNKRPPKNGKTQDKKISVLVVDGNALLKVAYNGAKNEINRDGDNIGGIYQFLTILRKQLFNGFYEQVYVFWDGKFSGKLRYNLYKDYKSSRGKDYINGSIPDPDFLIQKLSVSNYLEELSIRQYQDEIIEGDDCVAYFCNNNNGKYKITIMTNDRDMAQLIDEDVKIYLLDKKFDLTQQNYKEFTGVPLMNSLFVKIVVGDTSDSIKGIKGLGLTTLLREFPEVVTQKVDVKWLQKRASELQDIRLDNKKKPLKVLTNIIETITDGIQGNDMYLINEAIMDLKNPLMTEESIEELDNLIGAPLDFDNRSMKNVHKLMESDKIVDIIREHNMDDYLHPFKKIITREKKLIKSL